MINVLVKRKDDNIIQVTISGHANYSKKGSDIVCAGVSAVTFGIINSISSLDKDVKFEISNNKQKTGYIQYKSLKSTKKEQILLEALVVSLKTIEESYSKYIDIEIREVK